MSLAATGGQEAAGGGNVLEFIVSLSPASIDSLYADFWTCQAVFRSLPQLAKQYVLRLVLFAQPVAVSTISSWILPSFKAQHDAALKRLVSLRIVVVTRIHGAPCAEVSAGFRTQMHRALCRSDEALSAWVPVEETRARSPDPAALEAFSKQCWEKILLFIVGTDEHIAASGMMTDVLVATGLVQIEEAFTRISSKGFQFLLSDMFSQLWSLLVAYINLQQTSSPVMLKEILSVLFQLSFLTPGAAYPLAPLRPEQRSILSALSEFGLVMMPPKSEVFFPTRVGVSLCSGSQYGTLQQQQTGFIVVETNYRLYAYTSSALQISLLGLFVNMQIRLANMAVGVISRESVRQALQNGITAAQILHYLELHAHPQMRKRTLALPETVCDQIRLWEAERNRVTLQPGTLYDSFGKKDAFERSKAHAQKLGVYLWSNAEKMLLFVSEEGHQQMRDWMTKSL
jgi:transcription initiation factor TFIIH subunit 4